MDQRVTKLIIYNIVLIGIVLLVDWNAYGMAIIAGIIILIAIFGTPIITAFLFRDNENGLIVPISSFITIFLVVICFMTFKMV